MHPQLKWDRRIRLNARFVRKKKKAPNYVLLGVSIVNSLNELTHPSQLIESQNSHCNPSIHHYRSQILYTLTHSQQRKKMAAKTSSSSSSVEPLKKKKKECLGWIEWFRGWFNIIYEFLFQRIMASHLENPMPLPPINELTCIVTGSTSGIGLEIAR